MISMNGFLAGIIGGAIAVAFAKLLPALARRLKLLPGWIEGRTGWDIPDGLVTAFDDAIDAGVVAANSVFNRSFWVTVVNLLRKGKDEEAIQAFLEALSKVDWGKPVRDQIPPEWLKMWDEVREDVAVHVARSEVAPHVALTGNERLAAVAADDQAMRETVRASVIAQKTTQPAPHETVQPGESEETKKTIAQLIAESKERQAKLNASQSPK